MRKSQRLSLWLTPGIGQLAAMAMVVVCAGATCMPSNAFAKQGLQIDKAKAVIAIEQTISGAKQFGTTYIQIGTSEQIKSPAAAFTEMTSYQATAKKSAMWTTGHPALRVTDVATPAKHSYGILALEVAPWASIDQQAQPGSYEVMASVADMTVIKGFGTPWTMGVANKSDGFTGTRGVIYDRDRT